MQPLWWAGGAVVAAAALTMLVTWLTNDRGELAEEIEQRSQAPRVQQARLVDDHLEVDVLGHPQATHCLEAPSRLTDLVPSSERCAEPGQSTVAVPLEALEDPAALVDEEVVVRGRSTVTGLQDPEVPALEVESEPSAPARIVDDR